MASDQNEQGGGFDDGGGSATPQSCYAACDGGNHRPWLGATRNSRAEAQSDADKHNLECDVQGAIVICSS